MALVTGYSSGTLSVNIYEVDPGSPDDYVANVQMVFVNGVGIAQWKTVWTSDGFLGLGGNPEYKFVTLGIDSPELVVT
jgi:hypothetical protein